MSDIFNARFVGEQVAEFRRKQEAFSQHDRVTGMDESDPDSVRAFYETAAKIHDAELLEIEHALKEQRNLALAGGSEFPAEGLALLRERIGERSYDDMRRETLTLAQKAAVDVRTKLRVMELRALDEGLPTQSEAWMLDLTELMARRHTLLEERDRVKSEALALGFEGDLAAAEVEMLPPAVRVKKLRLGKIGEELGGIRDEIAAYVDSMGTNRFENVREVEREAREHPLGLKGREDDELSLGAAIA